MALLMAIETGRRSLWFAYGFALLSFLLALGLRWWADPYLPPGFPFLTFFPAVILTTFFAGLWPGIWTAMASGIAAWLLFIPPLGFTMDGPTAAALTFFYLIVAIDVAIIHIMNQALIRVRLEQDRAKRAEAAAQDLAAHRAVLFTELQHRISNNLQIVSALLNLQRSDVSDEKARRALSDAANRLALIGRIQRRLHDPGNAHTNFGPFLRELVEDVVQAGGHDGIKVEISATALPLGPDRIIPAALIVTELVNNCLEHAFPGRDHGIITIDAFTIEGDRVGVMVVDDGAGLPDGFDPATASSLGLRLVRLLTQQLGGMFEMTSRQGTRASVSFPAG